MRSGHPDFTRKGDTGAPTVMVSFAAVTDEAFEVFLDEHGVCVVRGQLDESTGARLGSRLLEHPEACCLDLGEVSFVDSAGLRCLLIARQRLADRGATLVLRRSSSAVRRLFRLAGVSRLFAPIEEQGPTAAG